MNRYLIILVCFLSSGCSHQNNVTTVAGYCELITGQYKSPFWADIVSTSIDSSAVMAEYTNGVNEAYLDVITDKASPMAWQEGTALHIVNVSSTTYQEPEVVITQWKEGIDLENKGKSKDHSARCFYGIMTNLFDSVHIHSMDSDAFGKNWTDEVTIIHTGRLERERLNASE